MEVVITAQTIITASSFLAAATAIIAAGLRFVRWVDRQKQQDGEIKKIRETHKNDVKSIQNEQTLIIYGLLACLKGLKEQGCNGPVTEAISKIEKHLNEKAHE